ncbi:MAG TPA: hypothetical protein DCE41_20980 [Cytophagales bacterium]|nr:hypothetical protein [Cytophagales bacterium]HAA23836.1 hypothetical protein [Cytophagales bacterium]HAP59547.1 hypothetical protein [Cytophagales bacterium]
MEKLRAILDQIQTALVAFFSVLRITWFIALFHTVAFAAFTGVSQTQDILQALVDRDPDFFPWPTVFLLLFMATWCITSWYSARIILILLPRRTDAPERLMLFFETWLPRVYGITPVLILAYAMPHTHSGSISTIEWLVLGFGVVFLVWVIFRKRSISLAERFEARALRFNDLDNLTRWVTYVAILLSVLALIIFIMRAPGSFVAQAIGTPAILLLFFTTWTVFFMIISYQDQRTRIPITILLLIYAGWFTGNFNDGHYIRLVEDQPLDKDENPELYLEEHIQNWIGYRKDIDKGWGDSTVDKYPIIFISAEGGGIRSSYWTAQVLSQLEVHLPGFSQHIYSMSGVSGGSLGVSTYACLMHDMPDLVQGEHWRDSLAPKAQQFLQHDFLSPVGGALLYPTLLAKAIPAPIPYFDRSRWLEDAWSRAYAKVMGGRKTFDKGVVELWKDSLYNVPALFLNSSRIETGQWLISSQLDLETKEFANDVDLVDTVGYDVPVKTATLMSARFPIVSPPGFVPRDNEGSFELEWTHGVDGGFLDNSGLETTMKVVASANRAIERFRNNPEDSADAQKLYPVVIMIKNTTPRDFDPAPIGTGYELLAPLDAVSNGQLMGIYTELLSVESFFNSSEIPGSLFLFQLDNPVGSIPLGWFLSEISQASMNEQAEWIIHPHEADSMSVINHQQFDSLRSFMPLFVE